MEKNAIGQRLETAAQTTPGMMMSDQNATVTIFKDDTAEKRSAVITPLADISAGAGSDVANASDNAAGAATLASVLSDTNEVVINSAVGETVTPDVAAASPSSSSVINGDAEIQPITKMARRENADDAAVSRDQVQQLVRAAPPPWRHRGPKSRSDHSAPPQAG